MNAARYVTLGNVGNLVRQHTGQFILVACGRDQACVYADIAAGQGECIDTWIVDDEESEREVAIISLCGDAMTNFVDVLIDLRVFDNSSAAANISHDRPPDLRLGRFRQKGIGRATHVGQLNVIGTGATRKNNKCHE